MKKMIFEIVLGLTLPTAIFHTQLTDLLSPEKPISKEISYSIARDTNYNEKVYDMSAASVHIIIFKVRGNKQTILWDKVYGAMQLKKYPTLSNALSQTVTVHNILDRKEKLFVTYFVTYDSKGSVMQIENGTAVSKGENKGRLTINL